LSDASFQGTLLEPRWPVALAVVASALLLGMLPDGIPLVLAARRFFAADRHGGGVARHILGS